MTRIFNDAEIFDSSLFINNKVLVLSDLHIGQDSAFNNDGFLVPKFQFEDLMSKTAFLLDKLKPELVVLNGDVKHDFSGISRDEFFLVGKYLSFVSSVCKVIIIRGNHDSILSPLLKRGGFVLNDYFVFGDYFICHGDKFFDNEDFRKSKKIIIGHEHPAIILDNGLRREKFKCFLKGEYADKSLIVMPSLNPNSEGINALDQRFLGPFLKKNKTNTFDSGDFEVFVVGDDEVFSFNKLKDIKKTLN